MNITKFQQKHKGFTLIEMLVVIAIIGILAGIVLVVLANARIKARDARIISEMGQIRSAAAVYYDDNTYSFTGLSCGVTAPPLDILCVDIDNQGGVLINPFPVSGDGQNYCVEVQLNLGSWWCVDGMGRSARYGDDPDCEPGPPGVFTCEE